MKENHTTNFSNILKSSNFDLRMESNQTAIQSTNMSAMDFVEYRWSLIIQAAFGVFIVIVGIFGKFYLRHAFLNNEGYLSETS